MKVYVVEIRQTLERGNISSSATFIASTIEKARDFCKQNTDMFVDNGNPSGEYGLWWFVIVEDMIDVAVWDKGYEAQGLIEVWDCNGNRVNHQPVRGYDDVKIVPDDWEEE